MTLGSGEFITAGRSSLKKKRTVGGRGVRGKSFECLYFDCTTQQHPNVRTYVPDHQEMGKIVDLHGLFVIICAPLGMVQTGLVHTSVADESIDGLTDTKIIDLFAKGLDTGKGGELTFHGGKGVLVKTIEFRDGLHLLHISDGTNHMVLSSPEKGNGSLTTKARGCAGNDNELCQKRERERNRYK